MIATFLMDIANNFIGQRKERKAAEHEMKMQQIKAGQIERSNGWKDEYALLVISAPFIACFFPDAQPHIKAGFEVLKNSTPEWYQYVLVGGFCSALGINIYRKFKQ